MAGQLRRRLARRGWSVAGPVVSRAGQPVVYGSSVSRGKLHLGRGAGWCPGLPAFLLGRRAQKLSPVGKNGPAFAPHRLQNTCGRQPDYAVIRNHLHSSPYPRQNNYMANITTHSLNRIKFWKQSLNAESYNYRKKGSEWEDSNKCLPPHSSYSLSCQILSR